MLKRIKYLLLLSFIVIFGLLMWRLMQGRNIAIFNPQGTIANQQRDLLVFTLLLSLVVVVPVFSMLFIFAWKFRDGNKRSKYRPTWDGNNFLEAIWWGIPCIIILILGVITWRTSHKLDPYKKLDSSVKPVTVQVVALQWRWLFIYPEQGIASINQIQFPEKTPLNFQITADAPMNSFWIPNLGGQIYAMSGMTTKLHLMADGIGDYPGVSANISGEGFSDMKFVAKSVSKQDFLSWVNDVKSNSGGLDWQNYQSIYKPATSDLPSFYRLDDNSLFNKIVMKYMPNSTKDTHNEQPKTNPSTNYDNDSKMIMESM